jgi:endonuclease/exonuclease/phosphatase family metal-dependent hydrolase
MTGKHLSATLDRVVGVASRPRIRVGGWLVVGILGTPALLLTALRLTQPPVGTAVRLVSFAPYALILYALTGVALGVVLVLSTGRSRLVAGMCALAMLGPVMLHGAWLWPQFAGSRPRAEPSAEGITVLTANMFRGRARGSVLISRARAAEVDLLSLQEVTPELLAAMEVAGLSERWPYRVGDARPGAEGTMLFSRYPLSDPVELDAAQTSWSASVQLPDGSLRVMAIHATSPTSPREWRRDHLAILAAVDDVDVLLGDFNATPDHRPMMNLADAGYRSVAELTNQGWAPTWPASVALPFGYFRVPQVVQIDHVLVGAHMTGMWCRRFGVAGSDHQAVLARISTVR